MGLAKETDMGRGMAANWWTLALRGLAGLVYGVLAFVVPGVALFAMIAILAAYLFVDGAFALTLGVRSRSWLLGIEGLLGVVAGLLAIAIPAITALVLLVVVAAWALLTGALEFAAAVFLRRFVAREWLLLLGGVASVVFGILLLINPAAGLLTIVWLSGAYAVAFGVIQLALAFRLRGTRRGPFYRPRLDT